MLRRILDPRQPGSAAGSKAGIDMDQNNPFARREAGPNQSLANKADVLEQKAAGTGLTKRCV